MSQNKDAMPQTPHEKAMLVDLLKQLAAWVEQSPTTTPCAACKFFDNGMCRDAQQMIPADVLLEGCGDFKFDPESSPF